MVFDVFFVFFEGWKSSNYNNMIEKKKFARFRYSMKTERFREQKELVMRELPHREKYRSDEVLYYLTLQGFHID